MIPAERIAMSSVPRFTTRTDGSLDDAMVSAYRRDGFLILESFASDIDCEALRQRMAELVEEFDASRHRSVFSTKSRPQERDRYFLDSGEAIRFFFEEDAFDATGNLIVEKKLALNKVGHALHDLDPVFDRVSRLPRFARLAASLGLRKPLLLQSMYIFKQPFIGGEVDWHQDAAFLFTQPSTTLGFWLAIDDATQENGCMFALAGAHHGPLRRRFLREGESTRMETLNAAPWPDDHSVPLEAPRGSLIVLHGLLPHYSGANRSPRPRHAYTMHLIDGAAAYPADNWLQRHSLPLRGFE